MRYLLPTLLLTAAAAQTPLIPIPREFHALPDQNLPQGVRIACPSCDTEDQFAAEDLTETLKSRGIPTTGTYTIQLTRKPITIPAEGYEITSSGQTLTISAPTAAGIFYGAQTAKQLIVPGSLGKPAILHPATIRDWPAMKYRGLHDDLSRGPIPTLAFQKHLIQQLAAYKINLYSPYFESSQQFLSDPLAALPNASITPAEARELSAFAARYHVMVVPEQEAFGHLRHILQYEQYADVAETPTEPSSPPAPHNPSLPSKAGSPSSPPTTPTPPSSTSEPTKPSTSAWAAPNPTSTPAVEPPSTSTSCSRSSPPSSPSTAASSSGETSPRTPPPSSRPCPNPSRTPPSRSPGATPPTPPAASPRSSHRSPTPGSKPGVAPSINNYRQVYPNYNLGLPDIQQFTLAGQRAGATGQLNTLWNDDGESLADHNWYGILFGAAAAWQPGESSIPAFQSAFGPVFHGDQTGKINQAQLELSAAMDLMTQAKVIAATEGSDGLYWVDPWTSDGQKFAEKMRPINAALRLHAERALTLIAEARAANPALAGAPSLAPSAKDGVTSYDPTNAYSSPQTNLREPNAINAMEFGARRIDFLGLKFQLADEMAAAYARAYTAATSRDPKIHRTTSRELSDINGVNGRLQDLIQTYSLHRDLFAQTWLRTNRPYALRTILEHYDHTISLWYTRVDKLRSAQRQYSATTTLPPAATLDIPPVIY